MDRMLLIELRALLERQEHEVDKDWIEGIRKSWKALVKAAATYPGRVVKNDSPMTQETILEAVNSALRCLAKIRTYLDRLRSELLITKGLWSLSTYAVTAKTTQGEIATKITSVLDAAMAKVDEARSYSRSFAENPDHYNMFQSQHNFDFGIRGIGNNIGGDLLPELDALISGKLLRFLSSTLTLLGGETLGTAVVPDTVAIGKLTVTFLDTSLKGKDLNYDQVTAGNVRTPHSRDEFLKALYKAQALLNKRDLGFLWYGSILVLPRSKIDIEPYKASKDYANITAIGATYSRKSDTVRVYADELRSALVIHEIGHRFYYKFMTSKGRDHFDKWFGQVSPASSYGGTNAAEDFAEVFAAYVKGKDLSRDQIERFKSVLNTKATRTEVRD